MSLASRRPNAPTSMVMPGHPASQNHAASAAPQRPIVTLQREQLSNTAPVRVLGRFSTPSVLSLDSIASALPAYEGLNETENPDVITTSCEVAPDSPAHGLQADNDATPRPASQTTVTSVGDKGRRNRRRSFKSFFRVSQKEPISMTVEPLHSPGVSVAQPHYLPTRDPRNVRTGFPRTIPLPQDEDETPAIDPIYWFATIFRINTLLSEGSVRQAQALLSEDPIVGDKVSLVKRSEAAALEALPLMSNESRLQEIKTRSVGESRSRSTSPHIVRAAALSVIGMPHPLQSTAFQYPAAPGSSDEQESHSLATQSLEAADRRRASSIISAADAFDLARRGSAVSMSSVQSTKSTWSAKSQLRNIKDKLEHIASLGREEYVLLFE